MDGYRKDNRFLAAIVIMFVYALESRTPSNNVQPYFGMKDKLMMLNNSWRMVQFMRIYHFIIHIRVHRGWRTHFPFLSENALHHRLVVVEEKINENESLLLGNKSSQKTF